VVNGEVPLVVCVTADVAVRERVVRRLDDCGTVVICTDLAELRAMLFPPVPAEDPEPAAPVVLGDLVVDVPGHLVTWRGEPLALTRLERELLARLATPPVVVWTYERLFGSVWGGAYLGDTAILHSAVKRLRRKLRGAGGGLEIQTVRGVGYRLASSAPDNFGASAAGPDPAGYRRDDLASDDAAVRDDLAVRDDAAVRDDLAVRDDAAVRDELVRDQLVHEDAVPSEPGWDGPDRELPEQRIGRPVEVGC